MTSGSVLPTDLVPATGPSGPLSEDEIVHVTICVRPREDVGSAEWRSLFEGPPTTRSYLSRQELAERFGADPAAVEAVEQFADKSGLTIEAKNEAKRSLVLSGTALRVEQAFNVKLLRYEEFGGDFHGYEGEVEVPEGLAGLITAIFGLNNRINYPFVAPPGVTGRGAAGDDDVRAHVGGRNPPALPTAPGSLDDLAALYAFPTQKPNGAAGELSGDGVTVGILRIGGAFAPDVIQRYFAGHPPSVVAFNVNQLSTPQFGLDVVNCATLETYVDIEAIGTLAPNAKIIVYYAGGPDPGDAGSLVDLIKTATQDSENSPSILSLSWGIPEHQWDLTTPPPASPGAPSGQPQEIELALQHAAAVGITVCAACGDYGSSGIAPSQGGPDGRAHVVLPAASPHALGVGGTIVTAQGTTMTSEVVWNDNIGATGGGVSDIFDPPTWQQHVNVPPSANAPHATVVRRVGRGVPDVAAHAGRTPYQIEAPPWPSDQHIGGTSVAAPIWAALLARVAEAATIVAGAPKTLGFLNEFLYTEYASGSGTSAFNPIVKGTNKQQYDIGGGHMLKPPGYVAKVGWDPCTGLGSPVGDKLLELLVP